MSFGLTLGLTAGGAGGEVPANVVTHNGVPVTYKGQYVVYI